MTPSDTSILIITDSVADAELVELALKNDYPKTSMCALEANLISEFERLKPQVLLFAFRSLEASKAAYLDLHDRSAPSNVLPHVSLVLCNKEELHAAYVLCRDDFFDDYILFWPMAHDARRLPMSVHSAVRSLVGQHAAGSMAQITAQARRIADLDQQLETALRTGRFHIQTARQVIQDTQTQIGGALHRFSDSLRKNELDAAAPVPKSTQISDAIARFTRDSVEPLLKQASEAALPLEAWMNGIGDEMSDSLSAIRMLRELTKDSKRSRPLLLVVDDDELMHKLLTRVLSAENFDVETVPSASAAIRWLRHNVPDLILMDVQMPNISGIQLTKRLKNIQQFSGIKIIMLTGRAEKQIIIDSRAAGATDVIVKPFERAMLLDKLKNYLAVPA